MNPPPSPPPSPLEGLQFPVRGAVHQHSLWLLDGHEQKHADDLDTYPHAIDEGKDIPGHPCVHLAPSALGEPVGPKLTDALGLEHANLIYLAEGSTAEVFEIDWNSRDNQAVSDAHPTGRMVMKRLKSGCLKSAKKCRDFERECEVLMRLAHPNIVTVYGHGESPRPFMAMEHLSGFTLSIVCQFASDRVRRATLLQRRVFPYKQVLQTALDVARALEYIHHQLPNDMAVIHRDVKPDNVGFDAKGTAKLIDFGICACVRKRESQTEVYMLTGHTGSPRYMAPEVALRLPYNESVDIYSLGVILWEMGALTKPYLEMNSAALMKDVASRGVRAAMPEHWPEEFRCLVALCWASQWQQRPTAATLVTHLQALLQLYEPVTCCMMM